MKVTYIKSLGGYMISPEEYEKYQILLAGAKAVMPHLDTDLEAHQPWQEEIGYLREAIAAIEEKDK